MNIKIKGIFLLVCSACVILLALLFFSGSQALEVSVPTFDEQMINQFLTQKAAAEQKRFNAQAARERAELQVQIYRCNNNEECVIVDKDPCGCLRGPSGVTAINAEWSLEFSKLIEKEFESGISCPSVASTQDECSATAKAVCLENRCQIVW